MLNRSPFRAFIALILLFVTVIGTAPLSAADLSSHKAVLGSLSTVGDADLRGVQVSDDATIFSGDRLRVREDGYAKVLLVNGQKLEIGANSDLSLIGRGQNSIDLQVRSGRVGFTSAGSAPLRITLGVFEITSQKPISGSVSFLSSDVAGVHILTGNASLRNTKTKESYDVSDGHDRLVNLKEVKVTEPLAQIASNVPMPLPQAGKTTSSSHTQAWLIAATVIGGGALLAGILIDNKPTPVLSAGATQTLTSATATAAQATTVAAAVVTTATAANTAITAASNLPPATKTTLLTQASGLLSAAQASQQQVATLQIQLQQLQTQLNGASGPQITAIQNQINTVTNGLNSEVTNLNNEINALNALVAAAVASGVPNTPSVPVVIQPIPPVIEVSASTLG